MEQKTSYKESGVDIDAGNAFVDKIKPIAKATIRNGCMSAIGGFGALFDIKALGMVDPIIVSTTDGVGTKLRLAIESGKLDTIGIDLVAMCVNDLLAQGAESLFFLDYFATAKLNVDEAVQIVKGIAEGCSMAGCALIGGETAEMPGMYHGNDFDLAGFAVGAVERDNLLPKKDIKEGDLLVGLSSSGFHSNGYSLVRHVIKKASIDVNINSPFAEGKSILDCLLEPTKIYVKEIMPYIQNNQIKAIAHITGGGLKENIIRVLPDNLGVKINTRSWQIPEIFNWIQKLGQIEVDEMLRTFNCGIGLVLVINQEDVNIADKLQGKIIGEVVKAETERVTFVS